MTPRFSLVLAIACALSCAFAWWLSGAKGLGWLAGYTSAAAISAWGFAYQERLIRTQGAHPFQALALAFLIKLVVIFGGALCVRFVPSVGERVDLTYFLIAFPCGVITVLAFAAVHRWLALQRRAQGASALRQARST